MLGTYLSHFDSILLAKAISFFKVTLTLTEANIEVKLVNNIGKGDIAGVCTPKFKNILDPQSELEGVTIEIKQGVTVFGMIEALAHEMVHAKQWVSGDISARIDKTYLLGFIPIFKARKFWRGREQTDSSYYDQPWEMEAHLMQRQLTLDFLKLMEDQLDATAMIETYKALRTDSI